MALVDCKSPESLSGILVRHGRGSGGREHSDVQNPNADLNVQ